MELPVPCHKTFLAVFAENLLLLDLEHHSDLFRDTNHKPEQCYSESKYLAEQQPSSELSKSIVFKRLPQVGVPREPRLCATEQKKRRKIFNTCSLSDAILLFVLNSSGMFHLDSTVYRDSTLRRGNSCFPKQHEWNAVVVPPSRNVIFFLR